MRGWNVCLRKEQSSWRKEDLIRLETQAVEGRKLYFTSSKQYCETGELHYVCIEKITKKLVASRDFLMA